MRLDDLLKNKSLQQTRNFQLVPFVPAAPIPVPVLQVLAKAALYPPWAGPKGLEVALSAEGLGHFIPQAKQLWPVAQAMAAKYRAEVAGGYGDRPSGVLPHSLPSLLATMGPRELALAIVDIAEGHTYPSGVRTDVGLPSYRYPGSGVVETMHSGKPAFTTRGKLGTIVGEDARTGDTVIVDEGGYYYTVPKGIDVSRPFPEGIAVPRPLPEAASMSSIALSGMSPTMPQSRHSRKGHLQELSIDALLAIAKGLVDDMPLETDYTHGFLDEGYKAALIDAIIEAEAIDALPPVTLQGVSPTMPSVPQATLGDTFSETDVRMLEEMSVPELEDMALKLGIPLDDIYRAQFSGSEPYRKWLIQKILDS